jgi:hypothetical protein
MKKDAVRQLLKHGPVFGVRVTEREFDEILMEVLDILKGILPYFGVKDKSDISLSDFEEFIGGMLEGLAGRSGILVIRLDGNNGFVFITTPDELVDFVRKRYGDLERLIDRLI